MESLIKKVQSLLRNIDFKKSSSKEWKPVISKFPNYKGEWIEAINLNDLYTTYEIANLNIMCSSVPPVDLKNRDSFCSIRLKEGYSNYSEIIYYPGLNDIIVKGNHHKLLNYLPEIINSPGLPETFRDFGKNTIKKYVSFLFENKE